ncbi:MAG: octaprenyl diphosphate synthase [Gammaproteobacteria bacterium]|jgi:octaprenyl-diphosphate synthase|nr:octaprenyl diphosphate synthase [Gammaproteobacteria bacterium]MBT5204718.1 octaprenyl diphosphate synthase [Gammaproteobacteria bacterium]MBT5602705.1 octaprenyl diphosphate synthase [Gammaproteobacteria bacterium]MBT6246090.1 octaprenyl diphosphate synthase [Gammaproteobacteria bacterium]
MSYPFYQAVKAEFIAVNKLIEESLSSHVPLVEEIASYLINAGGKRLRPLLVLLSARACDYQGNDHIKLAVIIEFLHTAMLLHDDVVDTSELRRGRKTANAQWGNAASVLVGDFLHSRAFEMMVEIGDMKIMSLLSKATNGIAEGEVQQLSNLKNSEITETAYREVIYRKTAMLFEVAAHTGAVLAAADSKKQQALCQLGSDLGIAFQLMDDLLDYEGSTSDLGKNVGDDLAEGKVTLPLIVALRNGSEPQRILIKRAIASGDSTEMAAILEAVRDTGGISYTLAQAEQAKDSALHNLEQIKPSAYRQAINDLVLFSVNRQN